MKHLILTIINFLIALNLLATTYWVSPSGNNLATGKSRSAAWQTISKVNSYSTSPGFQPGDIIQFKRGGTWVGTIIINNSGTLSKPIVLSTWGEGKNPVISGFTTITSWTNEGGGIYSKTTSVESNPEIVTINGVQYAMGRTPNSNRYSLQSTDYYHIDSHSGTTTITDSECNSTTTDWDGAEIVFKSDNEMNWAVCPIVSHSGTTLTITNSLAIGDGYGYFIQNDIRTLNQFGEWYYGSGKIYVYFGAQNPNDYVVKVSSKNTLLDINSRDDITVKNINFEGANQNAIETNTSSLAYRLKIENCNFNFNNRGVYTNTAPELTIVNSSFINNSFMAIYNHWESDGAYIANNVIDSTGLVIGVGAGEGDWYNGIALYSVYGTHTYTSKNTIIEYNTIKNSGYIGIVAGNDSTEIKYNLIDKYNINKSDGGAIYLGTGESYLNDSVKIENNICLNGMPSTAKEGQPSGQEITASYNIYLDNNTNGSTVIQNNISGITVGAGIMIHMSEDVIIKNNTLFDCAVGVKFQEQTGYTPSSIRNIDMQNNLIIPKTSTQVPVSVRSLANDFNQMGTVNNNKYAYIVTGSMNLVTMINTWAYTYNDLVGWRSATSYDANSTTTMINALSDSIYFYYNSGKTSRTFNLPAVTLVDINNTSYNTSITLAPFTAKILWKNAVPNLTGTFAAYSLEEASGSVLDGVGSHNGTATGVVRQVSGKVGYAYDYDSGTADRFSSPYSGSYPASESRTYRLWVKFDNLPSTVGSASVLGLDLLASFQTKFLIGVTTSNYLYISVYNTSNTVKTWTANKKAFTQTGVWYYVAVTIPNITAGEYPTLYLNGENVCTDISLHTGSTRSSDSYMYYPVNSSLLLAPDGQLDEINYWGRKLSPIDVWDDYYNVRTYPF